ncbi:hypothetical protein GWN63_06085 [Candidatus Bathyarchaeota archaeon]|nr:hypothetical protein [Candidatus Bathyarchaeota archaeon]NIU81790.1 hypothetical protein [Candidatus Bathyarchaeota archaeon]NIV68429.1 hypothetical protein [Candidatus Bathyarchaeota archaeon]NIW16728.1 hypothetical protein [Candidatus Bathyarchaeota archaeon]NIW34928.1 hypothetical protein [Candidatus Bathyarchaeota archaeon]
MKYCVWLKTNPAKTNDTLKSLSNLPQKPYQGIHLYYTMNVFGDWDCGLWFYAKNHEQAVNFVHDKIYPMPGVIETYVMPTSPIKEYINWK